MGTTQDNFNKNKSNDDMSNIMTHKTNHIQYNDCFCSFLNHQRQRQQRFGRASATYHGSTVSLLQLLLLVVLFFSSFSSSSSSSLCFTTTTNIKKYVPCSIGTSNVPTVSSTLTTVPSQNRIQKHKLYMQNKKNDKDNVISTTTTTKPKKQKETILRRFLLKLRKRRNTNKKIVQTILVSDTTESKNDDKVESNVRDVDRKENNEVVAVSNDDSALVEPTITDEQKQDDEDGVSMAAIQSQDEDTGSSSSNTRSSVLGRFFHSAKKEEEEEDASYSDDGTTKEISMNTNQMNETIHSNDDKVKETISNDRKQLEGKDAATTLKLDSIGASIQIHQNKVNTPPITEKRQKRKKREKRKKETGDDTAVEETGNDSLFSLKDEDNCNQNNETNLQISSKVKPEGQADNEDEAAAASITSTSRIDGINITNTTSQYDKEKKENDAVAMERGLLSRIFGSSNSNLDDKTNSTNNDSDDDVEGQIESCNDNLSQDVMNETKVEKKEVEEKYEEEEDQKRKNEILKNERIEKDQRNSLLHRMFGSNTTVSTTVDGTNAEGNDTFAKRERKVDGDRYDNNSSGSCNTTESIKLDSSRDHHGSSSSLDEDGNQLEIINASSAAVIRKKGKEKMFSSMSFISSTLRGQNDKRKRKRPSFTRNGITMSPSSNHRRRRGFMKFRRSWKKDDESKEINEENGEGGKGKDLDSEQVDDNGAQKKDLMPENIKSEESVKDKANGKEEIENKLHEKESPLQTDEDKESSNVSSTVADKQLRLQSSSSSLPLKQNDNKRKRRFVLLRIVSQTMLILCIIPVLTITEEEYIVNLPVLSYFVRFVSRFLR